MKPQFSIVTPSFKQLDWLRLAAHSVADQEGVTFEYIIQDGGTDGVEEMFRTDIAPAAEAQRELRLCVEKDAGMYDAINRGLAKSRGEICAWLNCDEQYLPGALRRVAAFFAAAPNIDIVFADALITDDNGLAPIYRRAVLPSPNHIRLCHLNTFSCATFFRRRVIEQHRLDPKWKSIGDAIWIYNMLKSDVPAAILPVLCSVFTLTGANLSLDNPVSRKEQEAWLAEPGAPSPSLRPFYVAQHRLRKWLAGAYQKRKVEYEIYLLSSPDRRVRMIAEKVGGAWLDQHR